MLTESFFQHSFIAPYLYIKRGYLLISSSKKNQKFFIVRCLDRFFCLSYRRLCRFDIPERREEKSYRDMNESVDENRWLCKKSGRTIEENELYRSFRIIGCEHLVCVVCSLASSTHRLKTYVVCRACHLRSSSGASTHLQKKKKCSNPSHQFDIDEIQCLSTCRAK